MMTATNARVKEALRIVSAHKENRNAGTRYAVSVEVCHLLTEYDARKLADKIRDRLNDISEDVYICVSEYEKVRSR